MFFMQISLKTCPMVLTNNKQAFGGQWPGDKPSFDSLGSSLKTSYLPVPITTQTGANLHAWHK